MPRSASTGVYTAPSNSFNPAVPDTVISSTAWNATSADYVTALGHTASTTRALYPTTGQVQDGAFLWGGTAGGTADALTITLTPAITAYAAGQAFRFRIGAAANTSSTPTLAVNGLAPGTITRQDGLTLNAGDLPASALVEVVYNGTAFMLASISPSQAQGNDGATTVTSASSITLTNTSSRVQAVTMTADAQSVFLPDARTMTVGGPRQIIRNAGSRAFAVRASNGNQIANGDFANTASWALGTGWSIAAGVATKTAGVQSDLGQTLATTAGVSYIVTFTITTVSAGTVTPVLTGGGGDVSGTARNAPGTYTEIIQSAGNTTVALRGNSTFAGALDNVSVTLAIAPLLASVPPGSVAECSLSSAATAQGEWAVSGRDLAPAFTVCDANLVSTLTQVVSVAIRLTDTLSLHFARNASGHPFVFAVDHSTSPATVGTSVLIIASNVTVEHGFRISNTKAFFKLSGTSSNCFNVEVSGTTCTVSGSASAAVFDAAAFTAQPLIVALGNNNDVFVALDTSSFTVRAQAVDASGATPSAGSVTTVSAVGTGYAAVFAIYRVTASTALALYGDNSGTLGSPYSIQGVVLSLSGTTITVNTSAGVSDVIGTATGLPVCQLSASSFLIGYPATGTSYPNVVAVSVSGTTVTFGTPLQTEAVVMDPDFNTRFVPGLFPLSATTALWTYINSSGSTPSRHMVLSVSGTTVTAGTVLYGLWIDRAGGNFPQATDGFLAASSTSSRNTVSAISISGTTLTVTGTTALPGALTLLNIPSTGGTSGGARLLPPAVLFAGRLLVYRFRPGADPVFIGPVTLPNFGTASGASDIEVAPSRSAFTYISAAQNGATSAVVKLCILEFAA